MNDGRTRLVAAAALVMCVLAGSEPRIIGDGGEYIAQALNFARGEGPELRGQAKTDIENRLHELDPALAGWNIDSVSTAAVDRTRDFRHFWFYALLVSPAMVVVEAIGAHPVHAFTATNLLLFGLAVWFAGQRIGNPATVLLFASPLVWWIDKPHTEVFTVSLLAVAFAERRTRPGLALVASGAAATQNLPVTIVFGGLLALTLVERGMGVLRNRVWLAGATIGAALALLHPAYTYWRHGTPSLLLASTTTGSPTPAELGTVVFDPTVGLLGNYPAFLLAVLVGSTVLVWRRPRALISPTALLIGGSAGLFLYSFAMTDNLHHGGTPSLSRYALWFVPLAVPLFHALHSQAAPRWPRVVTAVAVASAIASVIAFHPGVIQNSREPTSLASWVWSSHPAWNNPLPEIFSETLLHVEGAVVPVATDNCAKLLVSTSATGEALLPVPCYPPEPSPACREPNAVCYANRDGSGYLFVLAPGRLPRVRHDPTAAWPREALDQVRRAFDAIEGGDAARTPTALSVVREVRGARAVAYGSNQRFLLVLRRRTSRAAVLLRPVEAGVGATILDAGTGEVAGDLAFRGAAGELWTVDLPERELLVLSLDRRAAQP